MKKELVKALNELKNVEPTALNPRFNSKYAPLNKILDEVKKVLSKYGFAVVQDTKSENGCVYVKTSIIDENGVVIETNWTGVPLPTEDANIAQKAGAIITYLRRYTLTALLGIAADEDTDAEEVAASGFIPATEKQIALLKKWGAEELARLNYNKTLEELDKREASELIENIKNSR